MCMFKKKLKAMIDYFNKNISMAGKLRSFMIVIVIVPVILLNSAFYNMLQNVCRKQVEQSYEHTIDQYYDKIQYKVELYKGFLNSIVVNGMVQDILKRQYEYTWKDRVEVSGIITKEINSILLENQKKELYNVTLYPLNREFPSDGIYLGKFSDVHDDEWVREMVENKKYDGLLFTKSPGSKIDLLSLVTPVFNTDGVNFYDIMGIAKMDLNMNILFNFDDDENDFQEVSAAVLDNDYNIIFSSNTDSKTLESFGEIGEFSERKKLYIQNGNIIVCKKDIVNNLIIALQFADTEWQAELNNIRSLVIYVNMILSGILLFLIFAFSNIIVKRIEILTGKIKRVENGSLEITTIIDGKDEVAELDSCFNSMIEKIKELIDEKYIQQLEKTKAELKALQYQINPHFLYNTLEAINQMAELRMCSNISIISQNLGEMLRYNLDKNEDSYVPLEKEIYHIKNYVRIQQIRFNNNFDIIYDISDDAMNFEIFKFMLQPLLENALLHGLEGAKYRGYIEITAYTEDNELCVKVQDNGKGMSEEKVRMLMESINQKDNYFENKNKNSIGLQNVQHRIKLIYGEQYGLKINSKENLGTQIIIKIPKRRGCK